jgi:hypothetical protein
MDLYQRLMALGPAVWDDEVLKADEIEKYKRDQEQKERVMNQESKMQEAIGTAGAALDSAYAKLKAEKPEDRGEKSRCYAVCITELEKVMAYYAVFCQ